VDMSENLTPELTSVDLGQLRGQGFALARSAGGSRRGTPPTSSSPRLTHSSPGRVRHKRTVGLEGGCACGAVRYRLASAPMFVHCCHCLDCQRQTGSAFVLNALIEAERIELLAGEPRPIPVPTDSGSPHHITRCPACQSAIWSVYGGRAQVRFVRVGTLDRPSALVPDVHIYTRSKVPWVALPAGVPAFDAYYDAGALWPAESLARRKAALART
jgi:hypothetical protein